MYNNLNEVPEALVSKKNKITNMVWIVPIIAAIITLTLAVQTYVSKGPTIEITFKNGEGIEPGKTRIRFKNVYIGEVKKVTI